MMIRVCAILSILTLLLTAEKAAAFGSFEHIYIGDGPTLQFPDDGLADDQQSFTDYPYRRFIDPIADLYDMPRLSPQFLRIGDLKLSVGEIVAIAGDYFTLVGSTISDSEAKIPLDIRDRFLYAFSAFIEEDLSEGESVVLPTMFDNDSNTTNLVNENFARHLQKFGHYVPWEDRGSYSILKNPFNPKQSVAQLRTIFEAEFVNLLETDPRLSEELAEMKTINLDNMEAFKRLLKKAEKSLSKVQSFLLEFRDLHTQLVSKKTLWHLIKETFNWNNPPYYSKILEDNLDHFGDDAIKVYRTGHEIAIATAIYAYNQTTKENQRKWLNIAYALDAFASHFLSDQFSAGHMRTPRAAIYKSSYLSKSAGLAANAMHDEDGYYGLMVSNQRKSWKAYGDYSYFSDRSAHNRRMLEGCLRASFDEVYEAFLTGTGDEKFRALELIPEIGKNNFPALFKLESNGIVVRNSYDDIEDRTYGQPSLITWIKAWTYTPHWKESSNDVRWLLNQTEAKDSRVIEFKCVHRNYGNQEDYSDPIVGVELDLARMNMPQAKREKYFGELGRTPLLVSSIKVQDMIAKCATFGSSYGKSMEKEVKAFEGDFGQFNEIQKLLTYNAEGEFAVQEFPVKL